jgi:hypothetical protein
MKGSLFVFSWDEGRGYVKFKKVEKGEGRGLNFL